MEITLELQYKRTFISTLFILSWAFFVGINDVLKNFMLLYFITDFLIFYRIIRADMVFHHIISLMLIYFFWQDDYDTRQLVLTESSTPFLMLLNLCIFKNFNKALFIMTFFYFRIFNMGLVLIKRRHDIKNFETWLLFKLFLLNCWWAEIILRKHLFPLLIKYISPKVVPFLTSFNNHKQNSLWRQSRKLWVYTTDMACLHVLSFYISIKHNKLNRALVSLPLHVADLLFYNKVFLFSSIGYDIMLVFMCYKQDFLWLLGWILVALFNHKKTFGYGTTQPILCFLVYNLLRVSTAPNGSHR